MYLIHLFFQALDQMVKDGTGTALKLHKNVHIKSKLGDPIVHLRENLTVPETSKFNVRDVNVHQFEVSLKKSPHVTESLDQPLEDNLELTVLQKYTKKSAGKPYPVHR